MGPFSHPIRPEPQILEESFVAGDIKTTPLNIPRPTVVKSHTEEALTLEKASLRLWKIEQTASEKPYNIADNVIERSDLIWKRHSDPTAMH